jgi:hypothetical protein
MAGNPKASFKPNVDPSYLLSEFWETGICNTSHFLIDAKSGQASTRSAAQDFD